MSVLTALNCWFLKRISAKSVHVCNLHRRWYAVLQNGCQNSKCFFPQVHSHQQTVNGRFPLSSFSTVPEINTGVDITKRESGFIYSLGRKVGPSFTEFIKKVRSEESVTMTESDWDSLLSCAKAESRDFITEEMLEVFLMRMIRAYKRTELGLSLMKFISKKKVPTLALFSVVISMCGETHPNIAIELYEELLQHYSIFDKESCIDLIQGLAHTKLWKRCFELAEHIKKIGVEFMSIKDLSYIAKAAVLNDDQDSLEIVMTMANKYLPEHHLLLPEQFSEAFFNAWKCGKISTENFFELMAKRRGYLKQSQAIELSDDIERDKTLNYDSHHGHIVNGRCSICGGALKGEFMQDSQIQLLGQRLHNFLSKDKNVYMYSNPDEYEHFTRWLKGAGPFDIVIDLANLLCGKIQQQQVTLIHKLLKPFRRILVVSKDTRFLRTAKTRIKRDFTLYVPEHRSHDDVFMLIAAINSGSRGHIVSGDNFRDMKAKLGADVTPLFEQWQRYRQFILKDVGFFEKPQQYDFHVQEHKTGWHVPYGPDGKSKDSKKGSVFTMPDTLLCIKRKS